MNLINEGFLQFSSVIKLSQSNSQIIDIEIIIKVILFLMIVLVMR